MFTKFVSGYTCPQIGQHMDADSMMTRRDQDFNNYEAFDPSAYSITRYDFTASDRSQHILKCYHEAFQTLPSGLKVLDYGTGPVLLSTISAATRASEIVLSDYAEVNCKALRLWLEGDATGFDWSPHFSFVVRELEGKGESAVKERQEQVRKLVKAVVYCDITSNPPIEVGYDQLYDVVICSLVLGSASENKEQLQANAARLGQLVKPGGQILVYHAIDKRDYFVVGDKKFNDIYAPVEVVLDAFRKVGFTDLVVVSTYELKGIQRKVTLAFIRGVKIQ